MTHITKDGREIELRDLGLEHLQNIIKWIEGKATSGFLVRAGGGTCPDDMWYDEDEIVGEEALKYLNYYDYKSELNKRLNK